MVIPGKTGILLQVGRKEPPHALRRKEVTPLAGAFCRPYAAPCAQCQQNKKKGRHRHNRKALFVTLSPCCQVPPFQSIFCK